MEVTAYDLALNIGIELAIAVLAVITIRARPRSHLNRGFLFFLLIFLLWAPVMLVKSFLFTGAPRYLYIIYRWSLSIAAVGLGVFALFSISLRRGRPPSRRLSLSLILPSLTLFCAGLLSPWVIEGARPEGKTVYVATGPLYPLMIASLAFFSSVSFLALAAAARDSGGYARVRNLNFLLGFLLFTLPVAVSGAIFHLRGNLDPTGASYYAVSLLLPLALFAYAMLRYRQLDIRIAASRATAYLLAVLVFGLPAAASVLLLHALGASTPVRYALYLAVLALTVLVAPPVLEAAERYASRLFLMGIYDPRTLLARLSSLLSSSQSLDEGVKRGAALMAAAMGLRELRLALHPSLSGPYAGRSLGTRMEDDGSMCPLDEPNTALRFLDPWSGPLFPADPGPEEKVGRGLVKSKALRELREAGLEAALPVIGGGGLVGMLLAGSKSARRGNRGRRGAAAGGLTPMDYDTLQGFAEILAPFVENRLLSFYLQERVDDLARINEMLREEERKRSDLADSTYRSLLGPLAQMRSAADLLKDRALLREGEKRREALESMLQAADELNRGVSRTVKWLIKPQEGEKACAEAVAAGEERVLFELRDVLSEAIEFFSPECVERITPSIDGRILLNHDRTRFRDALALLVECCLREAGEGGGAVIDCVTRGRSGRMEIRCRKGKGDPLPCMRVFSPLSLLAQEARGRGEEREAVAGMAASLMDSEVWLFDEGGESWGFMTDLPIGDIGERGAA